MGDPPAVAAAPVNDDAVATVDEAAELVVVVGGVVVDEPVVDEPVVDEPVVGELVEELDDALVEATAVVSVVDVGDVFVVVVEAGDDVVLVEVAGVAEVALVVFTEVVLTDSAAEAAGE